MTLPKRGTHSFWHNEEPITDVHEALEILSERSPTVGDEFHLRIRTREEWKWEIVAPWFSSGDSGGDRSGYDYYQIDPSLAERLVAEGLVEHRREPRMGYTEVHEDQLVISGAGRTRLEEFRRDMREKAESLLTPGVHTDLTGEIQWRGFRREHYRHGRLYCEFELPTGRHCRVYPEEGTLVMPEMADS